MQKNVALRIRSARQAARLTQTDLAARLRVSRSAVAQWENASGSTPATAHFVGLAQVLGCTFEWLATGRGRRLAPGKNVDPGGPTGIGAHHADLPGDDDPSPFADDGTTPAVALRCFARDDEEERLFIAFRMLDAFDRDVVLVLTETLSSRTKRAWRRNAQT